MNRLATLSLLAACLLAAAAVLDNGTTKPDTPDTGHRGVSWVAGREITAKNFDPIVKCHANWIVQTPFGWQRTIASPDITLVTGGGVLWGETDEGLRVTTELARRHGIRTMLKPHIWITDRRDGAG